MEHGVRLTLSYDGTDFAGFQAQVGQRTVQGVVAQAAARVCRHDVLVRGASRTDSGVHAEGQVAAFATARLLSPDRWRMALNRYLPPDVAVRTVEPCAADYQPRFDACGKLYRYLFHIGVARSPLLRRYAWHLGGLAHNRTQAGRALDIPAMHAACSAFCGTHDFRAFRAAADTRSSTVRTLSRVALIERHGGEPDLLALEVAGNAFMMNMVRILAGTLLEVGRGRLDRDELLQLLAGDGLRGDAGMTAPAHGLTLVTVNLGRLLAEASR